MFPGWERGGTGLLVGASCSYGMFETCLIGDEDRELLCLELLGGVAVLSVAISLQHLQHKTR